VDCADAAEALVEPDDEVLLDVLEAVAGDADELTADEAAPAAALTVLVADRGAEVTVWVIEAGALVRCETVPPTAGAADFTVEPAPPTTCDTADGVETDGVDTWGVVATGVVTEGTVTDGTATDGVLAEGSVTAPLDRDSTPSTHRSSKARRLPHLSGRPPIGRPEIVRWRGRREPSWLIELSLWSGASLAGTIPLFLC
jgi:hypothetical protein